MASRRPVPHSQPVPGISPAGWQMARERFWWPGSAGQPAGPASPALGLLGSRPGPGPALSGNGRQLCAGIGSEVEGIQVSKGCGVGEGRMGRAPLEQKQNPERVLPAGGRSWGWGPWRPAPACLRRMIRLLNKSHPTSAAPRGQQGIATMSQGGNQAGRMACTGPDGVQGPGWGGMLR